MERKKYSARAIVILCTVAYFASYFSRKTFAVVMVNMLDSGVLDRSVAGLVGTALFIFYGAGQLVSGYLGDKLSPKYLMFSGLMISAVCNLLLPIVPNQYLMIPVWAVNGFAQALLWPPIVRILSDSLSHEKYVTANVIVTSGAHVSTIVLYLYAPLCIKFWSYKAVFFTSTVFCVVAGVVFLVSMGIVLGKKEKEPALAVAEPKKELIEGSVWQVFKRSGILPIFICITVMGFMRDGIESWLPTLYSEAFGRDSSESILVSVALPIFSIISVFLIRIIHKGRVFNNESRGAGILFALSIVLCIPFACLVSVQNTVARVICLLLAGVISAFMHSVNFLLISCLPGRFAGTGKASTVGGFCNACTYAGAAVSMYGIALISEKFGWTATIISWIVIMAVGVVFSCLAFKKYTKFLKK
ncbi:MAG: MFS transporter [Clostridia bacterium]|nr:MFS transporter [Clostridia bacterium]